MTEHKKHLYYMSELSDYKISDGYPDIRGWDLKDFDNRVIGKVDNLLVNRDTERVVYIDVEVDKSIIDAKHDPYARPNNDGLKEFLNKDGENHIIIPIGLVDLNSDTNYAYTDIIDHRTFSETKRYRKGDVINRNYERQVLDSYERKIGFAKEGLDNSGITNLDNDKIPNEDRIRQIIRSEIRNYHNDTHETGNRDFGNDNVHNNEWGAGRADMDSDDYSFYEQKEFDDSRFRKRNNDL